METPLSPLISLDEISNGYLDQHQRPAGQYRRIYSMAIRGFRLFYRDSLGLPKSVTIPIQANGVAVLPTDFMSKIQIGVLSEKGEFASLVEDNNLSFTEATSNNRLDQTKYHTNVDNTDLILGFQDYNNGIYPGCGYGQLGVGGSGLIGSYRIDYADRVIVLNFHYKPTNLILEYLAMPTNDGEYSVHPFFQEALIAYIRWQDSIGNKNIGIGQQRDNKAIFDMEYKNARRSISPFDPSDASNQYRQSMRLAVKS